MTEQRDRVNGLIARIEKHQADLALPDKRFVGRYGEFVGSAKTWRERLCARKWSDLGGRLDRWEEKLNRLVLLLDGGQEIGEVYEKLPIAEYAQDLYDQLQGQRTDRRVGFLIGPTGIGKSWVMKWLAREARRDAVYLYVNECWSDSMMQISQGLALAIGAPVEKYSGRKTFAAVSDALRGAPMTVLVDDAQKMGVLGLKLIKSLVDDTRAKFLLGVYPTSWSRLVNGSTDALAEAQQILGRTIKPIADQWMEGVRREDIEAYLAAAGVVGERRETAERIRESVRRNGNLRLLADAVGLARLAADERDAALTAELVEEAVAGLCPQRRK